ncbi:hypothetical protein JTE90_011842 [Oedothorax gibbosus]|uniref:sn-1-specific diacylglycerol lipase ABHD11 n=1 Tax=Oedothorax gibbosus TaxID=931172 RepID=A0AAV6U365_9ARAC|nr:hypothetical protein JTE90_011842 [Oedothorax gibbosus]
MESSPAQLAFNVFTPEGGAENKSPVIFMHGVTASKENWYDIPQKTANATKRIVYALDARNHGDSEWRDYFTFDCNVDDLFHFMDSNYVKKAILVGHSMGGIIGIKAALRQPERVEKLVVEDMYVKRVTRAMCDSILVYLKLANEALDKVPPSVSEETAKKFIVQYIYKNLPPELENKVSKRKWTDIELKKTADGRYTYRYNAGPVEKLIKNIDDMYAENTGLYKGAALFIYGKLSPYLVGEEANHIKEFFPNAEMHGIYNASHRVHTDSPQEFTETLLKFLLKE